jgi:hypothetical protein
MATYSENVSVTDAATVPWALKTGMLASTCQPGPNWTVVASGNAVQWTPQGDVLTDRAMMLRAGAWWVLAGHRWYDGTGYYRQQLCFQVDGAGGLRWKVSPRAGFTDFTACSPTVAPTATDQRVRWGGGTDSSPTYTAIFPTSGSWLQARYDEATDAMWAMCYPSAGGLPTMFLAVEPTSNAQVNGIAVDKAPWVYQAGTGVSCSLGLFWGSELRGPLGVLGYGVVRSGIAQDAWVVLPAGLPAAVYDQFGVLQIMLPGALPQSPGYLSSPVYAQGVPRCGRRGSLAGTSTNPTYESGNLNTVGDKGDCLTIRYSGQTFSTPTLLTSVDPCTGVTGTSLIGVGSLVLPWGGTPSLSGGA